MALIFDFFFFWLAHFLPSLSSRNTPKHNNLCGVLYMLANVVFSSPAGIKMNMKFCIAETRPKHFFVDFFFFGGGGWCPDTWRMNA